MAGGQHGSSQRSLRVVDGVGGSAVGGGEVDSIRDRPAIATLNWYVIESHCFQTRAAATRLRALGLLAALGGFDRTREGEALLVCLVMEVRASTTAKMSFWRLWLRSAISFALDIDRNARIERHSAGTFNALPNLSSVSIETPRFPCSIMTTAA